MAGAGPTGLTLAIELLRRDVSALIVDRAPQANPHAKAVVLWPRAMEAFGRLGIIDRLLDIAIPITAANYYAGGRRIARITFKPLPGTRYGVPVSVPQNITEDLLRLAFVEAGGSVEYGRALLDIERDGSTVMARLADGNVTAGWLVGCDGAHSRTRSSAGIPFSGAAYPQNFALVDGHWETPLLPGESYYFMHSTGVLVVVGLPGGIIRAFVSLPPDMKETSAADIVATVCRLAQERCPVHLRLLESTGSGVFTVQRRIADRFRSGRVLLAGDAAHVHSPAGGQGLNTSVLDAHELGWRLAAVVSGFRPQTVIDEWERERRHVAAFVVRDTDRQTRMWTAKGWRARVRDVALAAGERTGVLDRVMPGRLAQLDLAYPSDGAGRGRLRAGRRAADVPIVGGSLHDLLTHGGHAIAVAPPASNRAEATQAPATRSTSNPVSSNPVSSNPASSNGAPANPADWAPPWPAEAGDGGLRIGLLDPRSARALGLRRGTAALIRPDGVVARVGRSDDPNLAQQIRLERTHPPRRQNAPIPNPALEER